MSIAQRGKNNAFYGHCHTEETKKKISIANSGEKNYWYGVTGENNFHYGKVRSKETRKKMSIAKLGEEVYYQRLKDVEEIEKVWGWKSKLARKWNIPWSAVFTFIKRHT